MDLIGCLGSLAAATWAKSNPPHPLWAHCIDAGAVAEAILASPAYARVCLLVADASGGGEQVGSWCAYLVALHDIGKCDPDFQGKDAQLCAVFARANMLRGEPTPGFRHEAQSGQWLQAHLEDQGWARRPALTIAKCVTGHHGDFWQKRPDDDSLEAKWKPVRDELARCLMQVFEPPTWSPTQFPDYSNFGQTSKWFDYSQ